MNESTSPIYLKLTSPIHPLSIAFKLSITLTIALCINSKPTQSTWAIVMVLFAAFILVPIGYDLLRTKQSQFYLNADGLAWHLPCTLLLAFSFVLERGTVAGIFTLPYIAWCIEAVLMGLKLSSKFSFWGVFVTFIFLSVGAFWLVLDRFGLQPLGFSKWIVILTGVHFHYAGFTLMTVLLLYHFYKSQQKITTYLISGVTLGVIFTALGITATQMGYGLGLETFSGIWMATVVIGVGLFYIQNSWHENNPVRTLWLVGSICLILAMVLAGLYAGRSIFPLDVLTLSFMQAVHGTLNALGFGTLMLIGWALKK